MHHLYIYYQVHPTHTARLRPLVTALQARLRSHTEGQFYLRRKPQLTENGYETWLEVYENVPSDFETLLLEMVNAAGIEDLIFGARHVEHFIDS